MCLREGRRRLHNEPLVGNPAQYADRLLSKSSQNVAVPCDEATELQVSPDFTVYVDPVHAVEVAEAELADPETVPDTVLRTVSADVGG
jgi:hypothetical protein